MTREVTTQFILPSPPLRPYVHHYWIIQTYGRGISPIIMPTGCIKWIFHRKQSFRMNEEATLTSRASVCGPYDQAIHLHTQEELEMILVFFYPYTFHLFTGMPCQLFTNDNVDFDCLESVAFKTLKERVLDFYREFRHFAGMSPTAFIHYLEQVRSKGYLSAYKSYHNPEVVRKM